MKRILAAIDAGKLSIDYADKGAWTELTDADRLKIYGRCGPQCFMKPSEDKDEILKDPKKGLRFPICRLPPSRKTCAISASGLLAAHRRARLSKAHPDVVEETRLLMEKFGTTAVARRQIPIRSVRLVRVSVDGKPMFRTTLLYQDGVREVLTKPMSGKMILNRFDDILSPKQRNRLVK